MHFSANGRVRFDRLNKTSESEIVGLTPNATGTTQWPLRAVSLRNRNAYAGAVGGIRLTQSWEDLTH